MQAYGFLGSDVSKGMANFVFVDFSGNELEPNFQLDDNKQGHQFLHQFIKKQKKRHKLEKIIVGVESTGGYENNWYRGLRTKSRCLGIEIFRINPKRIYHEARTEGRRSITDGVSAQVIAGYLRKNYGDKDLAPKRLEDQQQASDVYANMKSLHRYIQRLIGQSTRTKNALEKLLYTTMPELLPLKGDKYSNWFLELLIRYPNREAILSTDLEELTQIPYLGPSKANKIYAALEDSVGSAGDEYVDIAISEQAQDIQQLNKKIKRLKKQLLKLAQKEKAIAKDLEQDIELISSINGIGEDTALGYILELGPINRFDKAKNLVAFWGINPTIKQSGDKNYYIGMSKDGSASARAILYTAAKNVVMHEPYFANIYHKQRKRGKSHRSSLGIVMAKLTRVIYGMLKSKKHFDQGIDIENQEKQIHKNSKKNAEKKQQQKNRKTQRRYQDELSPAPVSMVQRVKRKQKQNVSS